MIFRKGELFCGPGGLALGANLAQMTIKGEDYGVEHIWANDYEMAPCKTYARNIFHSDDEIITDDEYAVQCGKAAVLCKDVRSLNIDVLPDIDAFTFGFPCNDFSNVGEKKGFDGTFGPLYTYGVQVLKKKSPMWFLAENVGGLSNANDGYAFKKILQDLSDENLNKYGGYNIVPHLYKFEEYGVPQARHRIIIVGIRRDLGLQFKVPAPTTPHKNDYVTAKYAFECGNYPGEGNVELVHANNEKVKHPETIVRRLAAIPPGKNAWYEGIPEELRLNVKGAKLSNIYRRLEEDAPAYTVTGSGGGGTHMYHYKELRALSNRERARLQTFPDTYFFEGTKEEVRKQVGMAVPAKGSKIIYEAIFKTFAGVEYDFVDAKWDTDNLGDK